MYGVHRPFLPVVDPQIVHHAIGLPETDGGTRPLIKSSSEKTASRFDQITRRFNGSVQT